MSYFDDVKTKQEVFSMIYGNGKVCYVLDKKSRTDGFFTFQVQYETEKVYYTTDGVPDWCSFEGNCQTVYYKDDLDKPEMSYEQRQDDVLSEKKIMKLKDQDRLEIRTPSGAWINANVCPPKLVFEALRNENYYLFRKKNE